MVTTPITWPATANVIVHAGARPVFADVRDDDLNLDPARVREAVTSRTKAILPVHLAGQPCDLEPLWELGFPVVEDAAHAVESAYRGRKLGGLSDATCFSLYATKNVAAGEGGLVATNRDDVAAAVDDLRVMRRGHGSLYDIPVPGYKANLSDVLASIALVQLDKLAVHRTVRERHFASYDAAVAELPGIEPLARDAARHARAPPLRRPRRPRARRRHARRLPAPARRGADRHERPLPPGAHPERLSRALRRPTAAGGRAGGRRGPVAAPLAGALRRRHRGRRRSFEAGAREPRGQVTVCYLERIRGAGAFPEQVTVCY